VRVLFEIQGEAEETIEHRLYDTIYLDQMTELVIWWPLCDAHVVSLHVMIYLNETRLSRFYCSNKTASDEIR
jgi:hypothetical protein